MTRSTPTLAQLAPTLAQEFRRHGFTVPGLEEALGPEGVAALARSEPATARRYARAAGPAGLLVRFFILGDAVASSELSAVLPGVAVDDGVAAGLWGRPAPEEGGPGEGGAATAAVTAAVTGAATSTDTPLRSLIDLRPVDTGHGARWVFSDVDGSMRRTETRPDHVLGVGQATLSLLRITPSSPAGSVFDLGTGCGIQLVHALEVCGSATGSDITPRCLELAAATLAVNGLDAELVHGPWFEPVAGRRFDRIVANPPFVVGPGAPGHSYRESGLELDGASRTVVSGAADHLTAGGTAVILASWVERTDVDWRTHVSSWIPAEGVEAWILRRDTSDPALYVGTWLTDEGMDPRDEATSRSADAWLDHFDSEGVAGIGFGYVYLRRIDGPSSVLCEDLTHPFDEGLGDEAEAYFARAAWLREVTAAHGDQAGAVDATVFTASPDVRLHVSTSLAPVDPAAHATHAADDASTVVVERVTGARWRHEIDPLTATVLRGATTGALPLEDLVVLAAAGAGVDPDDLAAPVRRVVADLFLHGFVVPVGVPGVVPPGAAAAAPTLGAGA